MQDEDVHMEAMGGNGRMYTFAIVNRGQWQTLRHMLS